VKYVLLVLLACHSANRAEGAPAAPPLKPFTGTYAEVVYDNGITHQWDDYGWAPRQIKTGPATLDMSNKGGWIIARPSLDGRFSMLVFNLQAPESFGEFLEVRVDSNREDVFPRVNVDAAHRVSLGNGWVQVQVPIAELNPHELAWDRIVFRAHDQVGNDPVRFDKIGFVAASADSLHEGKKGAPPRDVLMAIDCKRDAPKISPLIYGIAFDARLDAKHTQQWQIGATARRWGGNTASRYNWQQGDAWSTASDWFFHNVNFTGINNYSYRNFLDDDISHKVDSVITLPILGWVAKDTHSYSFPVSVFGAQRRTDPYDADIGDGYRKDGTPIAPGDPSRTSMAAPPAFIAHWVSQLREEDKQRGLRAVKMYILDNEPALWSSTHRDVHPDPVTYDELLERTIDYGAAVRKADPQTPIAGPAEWGWPNYFFSAADGTTSYKLKPDRLAHGDVPLLAWYLRKLREYEAKTGTRVLDVLDVHYYPMATHVGGEKGGTDPQTAALRIRSTRSLWDPSYIDESWINDTVRLLPRLNELIRENYPGLKISIGEWNFGAEDHVSGGLATAEVLGRFTQADNLYSAFYWTYPAKDSPSFWAFRAFRNFDGAGGHFLDYAMPTRAGHATSLFASRDESGEHMVAVVLNLDPAAAAHAQIDVGMCGRVTQRRSFTYAAGDKALHPSESKSAEGTSVVTTLPPYSINVIDMTMSKK
jgi:hypothetical protein